MSDARKPKMKEAAEDAPLPKPGLEDRPRPADRPLSPEQSYLQRKAEVTQQDHEVFSEYLQEKIAREQQQKVQLAEPPPKAPTKVNRRSLLTWAAGTAVVGEAVTLGYPMVTGQSIPAQGLQHGWRHLYRGAAPSDRSRVRQSQGRRRRAEFRQLGSADADQARRRHLRRQPRDRPRARLDLILELRRLQSDLASPVRLPQRRSGEGLRVDQQHPGRQECPDLRHSHQHRDPGRRLQHLSRPL